MDLVVEWNPGTRGFCCVFIHDGFEYFADLCTILNETECLIFPSVEGEVVSWTELYCKRGVPVTESGLRECVEDFCNNYKRR